MAADFITNQEGFDFYYEITGAVKDLEKYNSSTLGMYMKGVIEELDLDLKISRIGVHECNYIAMYHKAPESYGLPSRYLIITVPIETILHLKRNSGTVKHCDL